VEELIREFQKHNGNITYSVKELVQALHTKLDLKANERDCLRRKEDVKRMTIGMTSFIIALLGGLAYYVFTVL